MPKDGEHARVLIVISRWAMVAILSDGTFRFAARFSVRNQCGPRKADLTYCQNPSRRSQTDPIAKFRCRRWLKPILDAVPMPFGQRRLYSPLHSILRSVGRYSKPPEKSPKFSNAYVETRPKRTQMGGALCFLCKVRWRVAS